MIMAIGERISFFRNLRGITQKFLGMQVGFRRSLPMFVLLSMKQEQELPKQI